MTRIFLFGTLRDAAVFQLVAGCPLHGVGAALAGERVACAQGGDWPVLLPDPQASAKGLLVEVGAQTLARLDFYEAIFGYVRVPVTVQTGQGAVIAELWRPRAGEPQSGGAQWHLAEWSARWGAQTCLAAEEMMRRFGRQTPSDVAQVAGMIRSRAQSRVETARWHRPGHVGSGMGLSQVKIEDRRHPYEAFFSIEEMRARFSRLDGQGDHVVDRAVFHVSDAVTVLPYDPVRDAILLIEQLRFGALAHGDRAPWLLEPIAGTIDAGETPEDSARRESQEEAGLCLGDLHFVARYYPSPGGLAQVLLSYVAIADLPPEVTGTGGHPGEGEDIQSHVVPFDLARKLLEGGDMANAPLIVSMQWLIANHDRLRRAAAG